MKYIVTMLDDKEVIFTFPNTVSHDRMWEAMECIRFGDYNWERKLMDGDLVSAGFVDTESMACFGRSESLDVDGRGATDTDLLRNSI